MDTVERMYYKDVLCGVVGLIRAVKSRERYGQIIDLNGTGVSSIIADIKTLVKVYGLDTDTACDLIEYVLSVVMDEGCPISLM